MGRPRKSGHPTPRMAADWDAFSERLAATVHKSKLVKALAMLRSERFQLFAEVHPDHVIGVVRSQSSATRVYSYRLASDGSSACCTLNLITCVVSRDSPCKHLLVLVVGLVQAGELDPATALPWLQESRKDAVRRDKEKMDKDLMAATFLRYKGVQAGEVDWRPTETIPEDFYAM